MVLINSTFVDSYHSSLYLTGHTSTRSWRVLGMLAMLILLRFAQVTSFEAQYASTDLHCAIPVQCVLNYMRSHARLSPFYEPRLHGLLIPIFLVVTYVHRVRRIYSFHPD